MAPGSSSGGSTRTISNRVNSSEMESRVLMRRSMFGSCCLCTSSSVLEVEFSEMAGQKSMPQKTTSPLRPDGVVGAAGTVFS